jgi:hypothetical protein
MLGFGSGSSKQASPSSQRRARAQHPFNLFQNLCIIVLLSRIIIKEFAQMRKLTSIVIVMALMGALVGCYSTACQQPAPHHMKGEG